MNGLKDAKQSIGYRLEIDGLRALAVLAVVVFHADSNLLGGGFVGVDVFFVISGFLITRIIHREVKENRFSLARFYERRVRRILPAFFAVLAVTTLISYFVVLPSSFKGVGRSISASSLSCSNILFWQEDGYFAAASEEKPLLHTWSLGVEEQFYIFLPLLVMLIARRSWKVQRIVYGLIGAVSFIASCVMLPKDPSLVFYNLPFRAWELLIGSWLAISPLAGKLDDLSAGIKAKISAIGVVSILLVCVFYSRETTFPGYAAVFPCLGAACAIVGRGHGWAGKILTAKPMVFVGKISYSFYLWHWPVLVLKGQFDPLAELPGYTVYLSIVLSFFLAVLSWRFVEQPFRRSTFGTQRQAFASAVFAIVAFAVLGIGIHVYQGVPQRFDAKVIALDDNAAQATQNSLDSFRQSGTLNRAVLGSNVPPKLCVFGDSHSIAIASFLAQEFQKKNASVLHFYAAATAPIDNVDFNFNSDGREQVSTAIEFLEASEDIEAVVLIGRWSNYVIGPDPDLGTFERGKPKLPYIRAVGATGNASAQEAQQLFEQGIESTVRRLQKTGMQVIIVYPIPEVGFHVPRTLAKLELLGRSASEFRRPASSYFERHEFATRVLDQFEFPNVSRVFSHVYFLDGEQMIVHLQGDPLYEDDDHLNLLGVEKIANEILRLIDRPAAQVSD